MRTSTRADSGGNPERGSLLLDVLIGMAIFALIALIAVSAVEGFRLRAYETGAISDADNLGHALAGMTVNLDGTVADAAALSQGGISGGSQDDSGTFAHNAAVLFGVSGPNVYTDPLVATGVLLSPGDSLTDWSTGDDGSYSFCVQHDSNGSPDAYAAYDSTHGDVYAHARGSNASCPSLDVTGAPGPSSGSPSPSTSSDPNPSSGPSDDPPSASSPPSNDECTRAIPVDQPQGQVGVTSSGAVTNIGATEDSSVWFHTYAPAMDYETYSIQGPNGGSLTGSRTLTVYRGPDSDNQSCPPTSGLTAIGTVSDADPGLSFRSGTGNQNYWIEVSSDATDQANFSLVLYSNRSQVPRDDYANAEPISASQNQTVDYTSLDQPTNLWATSEAGEDVPNGSGSIWYKVTNYYSTSNPTYMFATEPILGALNQPLGQNTVQVYSGGTSAASPGTLVASKSGSGSVSVTFTGPPNGGSYMIRIVSKSGLDAGYYNVRLVRGSD